jgi:uncharacterized membrane protein YdcZ (DUF606 family)
LRRRFGRMPVVVVGVGVEMSKKVGTVERTSAVVVGFVFVAVVLETLGIAGFGKKPETGL